MLQLDQQDGMQMYYNFLMLRDNSLRCRVADALNYEFMLEHNTYILDTGVRHARSGKPSDCKFLSSNSWQTVSV